MSYIMGSAYQELARVEFQKNYNFEFILPDIDGIPGVEVGKFCQSLKFGDYRISELSEIRYGAHKAKYAGFFDIENVIATFLIPVPDLTTEYFYRWIRKIKTPRGYFTPKVFYAYDAYCFLYDSKGEQSRIFKFKSLFPKNVTGYELSYDSQDFIKATIEFSVDLIERT